MSCLWLVPCCCAAFAYAGFFSSYFLGARSGHIATFIPFISDGGAYYPESRFFALGLCFSAAFFAWTIYLRHRLILGAFRGEDDGCPSCIRGASRALLCIGIASAACIPVLATFDVVSNVYVHLGSTTTAFILTAVYTAGQMLLCVSLRERLGSPLLLLTRVFLGVVMTAALVALCIALASPTLLPPGELYFPFEGYKPWNVGPESEYYAAHTLGAAAEWLMTLIFFLFVASFAVELRHASSAAIHMKQADPKPLSFYDIAA